MAEIRVEDIKSKFETLQSEIQSLKEKKIGYESQLSTLQQQYDEQLSALLQETGTSTLEEAVAVCKQKQEELNTLKETLSTKLDEYLKTVSGDSTPATNNSIDSAIGDFFK